jgi:hypothetical protein
MREGPIETQAETVDTGGGKDTPMRDCHVLVSACFRLDKKRQGRIAWNSRDLPVIFQHKEAFPLGLFKSVYHGDIGVIQRCQKLGLALEAGHSLRISGEYVGKELESNLAVQGEVFGQVDFPHAADTNLFQDPIVRNRLADLGYAFLRLEVMLPSCAC